jgi:glycosyltransferase involved in cell wall biosynthesis
VKVLLVDQNLVDPINHPKWRLFAAKPGVEMLGVSPASWIENFRQLKFDERSVENFPIVSLPVHWPGKENRAFFTRGYSRIIRSFKPEIIMCYEEPFSLFALQTAIFRLAFARKSRLVFITWDNLAKGHHFWYRPSWFYRLVFEFVMTQADLLLTANEEGTAYYSAAFPNRVEKLYYGVTLRVPERNEERLAEELWSLPADSFVVGYIGRLLEMKGIDTLLDAMKFVDPSVKLVILGSGPDEERLKAITKQMSLEEKVLFMPAVSSSQVRNVMNRLRVMVLPSRTTKMWKEQFGRVLVEAMACGITVVGSSSGAIPEVIGEAGLIFPEGDSRALANAIERLRTNPELLKKLSAIGIERAKVFSPESFADRLHLLLNRIA